MKGYIIDCDYIIQVKELMTLLPKPRKRLLDSDGTRLPLISIEVELW